ncbi:MAG: phasin family protein [Luteimonas sp.]
MATFKKTANKKTASKKAANKKTASAKADVQAQADRLSKTISESAQQIWLAGTGAFGRAQAEGSKLFEGLVKEGLSLEQTARKFAGRTNVVRDAVETRVDQARERATDTWDRLEKVFEDRVQRALTKLGVPGRDDLADLSSRVETLTTELRRQGVPARKTATRKTTARKTAARKTPATKTPARKQAKAAPAKTKAAKSPAKAASKRKS